MSFGPHHLLPRTVLGGFDLTSALYDDFVERSVDATFVTEYDGKLRSVYRTCASPPSFWLNAMRRCSCAESLIVTDEDTDLRQHLLAGFGLFDKNGGHGSPMTEYCSCGKRENELRK